jgi:DNA primase small subunit
VLVKGGAQQARKVNQKLNIHPAITRALDICTTAFEQCILKQQHILQTPEQWSKVLAIIPDETVSGALHTKWLSTEADSLARWQDLCDHVQHAVNTAPTNYALKTCLRDIVLQYCYPRLDDKVSTQLNHLLKAPFCIHPKTGRVCVPIDPLTCDTFDPLAVPTVSDLLRELQLHDAETSTVDTSLKPHIDAFKRFIQLDTRQSTLSLDY